MLGAAARTVTGMTTLDNTPANRPVLLAVDGNSLVHRSFHALAGSNLRTSDGRPTAMQLRHARR